MPALELYVRRWCPFCAKVRRFMEERGIEIALHDIGESKDDRAFLLGRGGKEQVPCLFIDGTPLYESDGIIAYLDKTFG